MIRKLLETVLFGLPLSYVLITLNEALANPVPLIVIGLVSGQIGFLTREELNQK